MPLDFNTAVQQEVAYISAIHPKPEDIPGCLSILDDFMRCNVLGSQLRSLYRYGEQAQCKHKFENFKFCLSLKALEEDERRTAWIQRKAEWWARRRVTKSSEDVWDIRSEPPKNYPPPIDPGIFEEIQSAVNNQEN
ncbi:hypothetical protein M422DRAFT_780619 [Sphaerobolus stellatus SS14]|uniref:Uncharacterized protein n=1 Tax=Sphaerobolus stellatus (strain SS14) TaxID=990650 RepID=A0A0C9VSG1_SPHS4|nr:hypothetical protein M422DRAFT_780619 [Sphaerobolus stellatus SS14]